MIDAPFILGNSTIGSILAAGPESEFLSALQLGGGIGVLLLLSIAAARNFLYICRSNEILIFTGRKRVHNGEDLGPMVITPHGASSRVSYDSGGGRGRAWKIPIIEQVERMDTTLLSIDIVVQNAYSKGNIPLQIHAIANVKLHQEPQLMRNAIERFLGRKRQEIQLVAQQTLEGAVREVLAQMTPEQVNEDRLTFAENLMRSAKDDLDKLGLQLDTLKIQNVSDDTQYLDSLGRPRIAQALRDAENAENQAMQEVSEAEAEARRRSETARASSQTATITRQNELETLRAKLDGEAMAVEREATAAAQTERAKAEQELQKIRAQLEKQRLQAEVIIPAEMDRRAKGIIAKGDASPTEENGKAVVEVLRATSESWKAMGPNAKQIYVIQHLEEIVGTVVENLKKIDVDEVSILDPGDGTGLSSYAAAYPQTIAAVLRSLRETTGVDVPAILVEASQGSRPTQTR
jgi:flotillin